MKNEEKYKSPEERKQEFDFFCNNRICVFCPCNRDVISQTKENSKCAFRWLALEAEEKKPLSDSTVCVAETVYTKNGAPIATWYRSAK